MFFTLTDKAIFFEIIARHTGAVLVTVSYKSREILPEYSMISGLRYRT